MAGIDGDNCSEQGAQRIADTIRKYWIKRGYPQIKTEVQKMHVPHESPTFIVRSNIGPDGFPPTGAGVLFVARDDMALNRKH